MVVIRRLKIPGGHRFDILQIEGKQTILIFESLEGMNALERLAEDEKVILEDEEMTKKEVFSKYICIDYITRGVTRELSEQYWSKRFMLDAV